jgi:hypothetical protein
MHRGRLNYLATALTLFALFAFVRPAAADQPYEEAPPPISIPPPPPNEDLAPVPPAPPTAEADVRERYVPPISQPYFNEPAQITTELRPVYIYHRLPNSFPSDGGHANIVAVQLRAAITERLAFIATKDGWADIKFDKALPDDDGFFNVAGGFKYAVISKPEDATYLTMGIRYEAPIGSLKTGGIKLQGGGDGMIDTFITGTAPLGAKAAIQASLGYDAAIDTDHDASFIHATLHADYEIVKNLYGLIELSVVATADHGNRIDIGSFEGEDAFNFGNEDSDTIIPLAFGARYRFTDNLIVGAAYEFPLDHKDITQDRVTVDAVIHF